MLGAIRRTLSPSLNQNALNPECSKCWRLRDASGCPPGIMGWWPFRAITFLEARPLLGAMRRTTGPDQPVGR